MSGVSLDIWDEPKENMVTNPPRDAYMVPRGVPNQVRSQQTPPQKVPLQQVPPQQVHPQQVHPQQVPPQQVHSQQVPHMRNEPGHVRNEQTKIPHAVTQVRSENVPQVQNQDVKKHKKRFFDFSN